MLPKFVVNMIFDGASLAEVAKVTQRSPEQVMQDWHNWRERLSKYYNT